MTIKPKSERTTKGKSYSGSHAGARRQLTDDPGEFIKQDAAAVTLGYRSWADMTRTALRELCAKAAALAPKAKGRFK